MPTSRVTGLLILAMLLAACPSPSAVPTSSPTIVGRIEATEPRAQALMSDVANAATVSLIDTTLNQTVATTVTNASGSFVLSFGTHFAPQTGRTYTIEAVKGLSTNRPGASGARVRTLLQYDNGWKSMSSATAGDPVFLGRTTTALALIASLRAFDQASHSALIGSLQAGTADNSLAPNTPDTFTPGATGIPNADYHRVFGLVDNALTLDQDPVGVIYLDPATNTYQRRGPSYAVTGASPTSGLPGATLTITGSDLPSAGSMTAVFGPYTAACNAVSLDRKTATFTVPGAGLLPEAASLSVKVDGIETPLGDFRYTPTLAMDFEAGTVAGWTNNTAQSAGVGSVVNLTGTVTTDNVPGSNKYLSGDTRGIIANTPSTTAYGTWKFDMIRQNHHEFWPIQNNTSTWMPAGEGYLLWVEGGGELTFTRVTGGASTNLAVAQSAVPIGKWGHYRIERENTGLWRVYENDVLKISVTDNTVTTSTYLGTFFWDVPANAGGLDNLKVWAWR